MRQIRRMIEVAFCRIGNFSLFDTFDKFDKFDLGGLQLLTLN
jgi:hypothetical protein